MEYRACSELPREKNEATTVGQWDGERNMTTRKMANIIQSFWSQALLQRNTFINNFTFIMIFHKDMHRRSWENTEFVSSRV